MIENDIFRTQAPPLPIEKTIPERVKILVIGIGKNNICGA